MSYYQGDYYRGDPGFFSFLGGLAKKAVGFIPGVGPIASAALSTIPTGGSKIAKMGSVARTITAGAGKMIAKHPVLSAAGAAGAVGMMGAGAGAAAARRMGSRRGAMGGRRRRMNVTNVRALRRSIRRTQGFAKLAMRTIHLVHPKKKARFGGFKRRTRKRA
jgi:hypothetical protein